MDNQSRCDLITRQTEEVLTSEGLVKLIEEGAKLRHYIGFEISGKVHLGTGVMTGAKIADFQAAGAECSCFLATWHAWINNKFGGDIDTIRKASAYFEEALRSSISVMGGDEEKVRFVHADKLYHHNDRYWMQVIEIAKQMSVNRALRAITICPLKHGDVHKPIAVHHHLLLGLKQPPQWPVPKEALANLWSQMKMSKSVPGSAIFVNDSEEEIRKKMLEAFCPAKVSELNPVLDYAKHIVFRNPKQALEIDRPAKFGGSLTLESYPELERLFIDGNLHPLDLKNAMADYLIHLLAPVRKRFLRPKNKKLTAMMQSFEVTR